MQTYAETYADVLRDSIVTGGSDGSMVLLQLSADGDFSASMPEKPLLPNHNGQVCSRMLTYAHGC
jgi:hypothetical protein